MLNQSNIFDAEENFVNLKKTSLTKNTRFLVCFYIDFQFLNVVKCNFYVKTEFKFFSS